MKILATAIGAALAGSLAASPAPAFSPILPPDYVRPWCMLEGYGDNEGEHKMVFGKPRRT